MTDKKVVEHVLMSLGSLRFSVSTFVYDQFKRSTAYRWSSKNRAGRRPGFEFEGPGTETIEMSGVIYTGRAGTGRVEDIRTEAARGKPLKLMDALGKDWGLWCITNVEEERQTFMFNGEPLKQTFSMSLTAYGEDQ